MTKRFRWSTAVVAAVGAAAVAVCGCGRAPEEGAQAATQVGRGARVDASRPNIILISVDSLRADHLHCYGYARETSPAIDTFAADAILFENAVAQAPWTLPSHASLLTSLYSRTHQACDLQRRLSPQAITLASLLKAVGYRTHAIVSGPFMHAGYGMDLGFDTYDDGMARITHRQSHAATTSPLIHARALKLLDATAQPFFLFLHYWDVHYDYIPPKPYDTRFDPDYTGDVSGKGFMLDDSAICKDMSPRDLEHIIALYDGEIGWVDEHIGRLLGELKRRGLYDRTIIVLTADHGDEFFEHGEKGHQHSLYQELLHVPLIVRFPGERGGRRPEERVQLIDIVPTLLDALRVEQPPALQGLSFWPLVCRKPWSAGPVFSETTKARKSRRDPRRSTSWCVFDGRHKLIVFAESRYGPELYDVQADPGEQHNLVGVLPHARLLARLERWLRQTPEAAGAQHAGLDEGTLRTLEALGYVDGGHDDDGDDD